MKTRLRHYDTASNNFRWNNDTDSNNTTNTTNDNTIVDGNSCILIIVMMIMMMMMTGFEGASEGQKTTNYKAIMNNTENKNNKQIRH